jgi:predicted nucleotidyltransferase
MTDYGVSAADCIRKVTSWANSNVKIDALALVGSHARNKARIDSDIDFILICGDMMDFLCDLSWVSLFGDVKTQKIENWGLVTSIRVFYTDGKEVEFSIAPVKWAELPVDSGTYRVVCGGMLILDDKKGALRKLNDFIIV